MQPSQINTRPGFYNIYILILLKKVIPSEAVDFQCKEEI
jgi:hypothetical protein